MTLPVLKLLLLQFPQLKLTFVSNRLFLPLFADIDRLHFHSADLTGKHKGIKGLYILYNELKQQYDFDAIADLHQVLRTRAIRTFFAFSPARVAVIDKGRKDKKVLTRKGNKLLTQLPSTFERYAEVFAKLGLPVKLEEGFIPFKISTDEDHPFQQLKHQGYRLIGVAPFAKHDEKMYPAGKMQELVRQLLQLNKVKVFLFGGGKKESGLLQQWEKLVPGVETVSGKMSLGKELEYISRLDVMVSMDSANMHLASLFGIPVISIWGATHPWLGFYGWGQSLVNAVQADLFCRPCSVFGNKTCYRGNLECMTSIKPETVYQKVRKVLQLQD